MQNKVLKHWKFSWKTWEILKHFNVVFIQGLINFFPLST